MIHGQDLEAWLIAIAQHTRETKEALEKGNAAKEKKDESWLDKLGKRIETGMQKGMATAVGQAKGLANSGMRGTVEQARYDYAMEQLGRQFAAVMSPVINAMTYGAAEIEKRMRGMGGSEQNRLMGAIIGGGLGLRFGGLPGGIFGAAAGAGAVGGGSPTGAMAGALGGALLGFRYGGPVGAVAGGAAGLAAGSGRSFESESRPRMYYDRMRREGATMFGASLSTLGESLTRLVSNPLPGSPATRAAAPRRDVTPFQSQMGDAGSTYFRMQEAMIRTTAGAGFEDAGPLKPIVDLLLEMLKVLVKISGGTWEDPAPPRGAMDGGPRATTV